MATYIQRIKKKLRTKKRSKKKTPGLMRCPQRKGSCTQILIKTPRKPSSGKRKVVRVQLRNKKNVNCHIPGIGHSLQKYSTVLVRGCRVRDIPAMKYRIIRGKFDAKSVYERLSSRSKYGTQKRDIFKHN
jgi:small subunit ribosomal protein S12